MKKYLRKIGALLMAIVMAFGVCASVFAADVSTGKKPTEDDKAIVKVNDVEKDATLKAYKIVTADYTDYGFAGYKVVDAITNASLGISNIYQPTEKEIQDIAKAVLGENLILESADMTATEKDSTVYTAELTVGTWLVLASGGTDTIYNPMLVSVFYKVNQSGDNNEPEGTIISAKDNWWLEKSDTYAKSEQQKIEKTIINSDGKDVNGAEVSHGADSAVGDTVSYNINSKIPSYSDAYKAKGVDVQIKDTLSKGLTFNSESIAVKVDNVEVEKDSTSYVITFDKEENSFTITFNSDYVLKNAGKEVKVTYNAQINENAGINFDPNTNRVKLIYTNNPQNKNSHTTKEDTTYHYTFGIDAKLFGNAEYEWNKETEEIFKTGEQHIEKQNGKEVTTSRLSGAEFTLTRVNSLKKNDAGNYPEYSGDSQKIWTASTNEYGKLSFTGLDAGYYLLNETKAPKPYALEGKTHTVEISAIYNEDGTLSSYTITIDGKNTSTYTATYENKTITNINSTKVQPTEIKNTTIKELPSTGGIGTYLFTIIGVMVMAAVTGMFLVSRAKDKKINQ